MEDVTPKTATIYTVMARLCRDGRQRGKDWCAEHCREKCPWGVEYASRLNPVRPMPMQPKAKPTHKPPPQHDPGTIPGFSEWVRRRMKQQGMTQRQLAKEAGISQTCVSECVRGDRHTKFFEDHALMVFGVPYEDVLREAAEIMKERGKKCRKRHQTHENAI